MTLIPGTRLGPYEIVAPLGAGGMGEVYRAKDAKLGREVAIKVLPEAVAADAGRRQRFEQEARSASALNHPNILTIYDIDSSEGRTYIAMELVEGRTLRELVAGGEPLAIRKLLDVATQTAEGLAKAHSAGIVHRDLKPENLMISRDGFVKILDFGLAKLVEPGTASDASALPTAVAGPTEPGTVMGTAGYMSPEQASGQTVDFRSDQFSLGTIVYEMATGKRAFQRKTGPETLVAVIREEPAPLSQVAPKSPAPVRWIVERLLQKDPEERYASTKDLARDLKSLRDHLSETSLSGGMEAAGPARARRRGWLVPALLALLLGAAAGFVARGLAKSAPRAVAFQRLTFQRGRIASARFAPDGQTIVYSAAWEGQPLEIYTTRTDSAESRSLGLKGASLLAVSSAGELAVSLDRHFVLGYEATGTLARVPLAGGAPRPVLEGVQDADWSPDGKELAVSHLVGNRSRLEYPIGKTLYEAPGWVSDVRVSPDGKHVAFIEHTQRGNNDGRIRAVDVGGRLLFESPDIPGGGTLAWSPRGDEIWFGGVQATTLDGKIRPIWESPNGALHDVDRHGRVLIDDSTGRREIVGFAASDPTPRNLTALNWSFPTDISPDGSTVLFNEQQRAPRSTYLRKLDGSPAVRLGEGDGFSISRDGAWVVAAKLPDRRSLEIIPTGTGEPKSISLGELQCQWADWLPDGRIVMAAFEAGRPSRIYIQSLTGGKPTPITPENVTMIAQPVSPDGKSLIARGPDGRLVIYPVDPPGDPRPIPGLEPDELTFQWTADNRSVYVTKMSALPGIIHILDVATGHRTEWKRFEPPDPAGVEMAGPVVVMPDGRAYVYSYRRVLGDLYVATGMK
jgi:eukaryotic-like serine/threonine-protein kinase